jgi:hypothetical protein
MRSDLSNFVMAGLDRAIHEPLRGRSVDDRDKQGHDDQKN